MATREGAANWKGLRYTAERRTQTAQCYRNKTITAVCKDVSSEQRDSEHREQL